MKMKESKLRMQVKTMADMAQATIRKAEILAIDQASLLLFTMPKGMHLFVQAQEYLLLQHDEEMLRSKR